jgi:hypothetical protein
MAGAEQEPAAPALAISGPPATPPGVILQCGAPDAQDAPAFVMPLRGRPDEASRGTLRLDAGGEYRSLRFREMTVADLEAPGGGLAGRFLILGGAPVRAEVRSSPQAAGGPEDVADLLLEDGTTARRVPRAAFSFEPEAP